jgi:hypothetical protein
MMQNLQTQGTSGHYSLPLRGFSGQTYAALLCLQMKIDMLVLPPRTSLADHTILYSPDQQTAPALWGQTQPFGLWWERSSLIVID